ncbi:hypothetical protein I7I48_07546 [Histoplasma ohiense]|nr:hypothetical protein I7I48_07546 [Histoplasma ohiense (nom. inval.)]
MRRDSSHPYSRKGLSNARPAAVTLYQEQSANVHDSRIWAAFTSCRCGQALLLLQKTHSPSSPFALHRFCPASTVSIYSVANEMISVATDLKCFMHLLGKPFCSLPVITVTFPSSESLEAIDELRFIDCFVDIEEASRL